MVAVARDDAGADGATPAAAGDPISLGAARFT